MISNFKNGNLPQRNIFVAVGILVLLLIFVLVLIFSRGLGGGDLRDADKINIRGENGSVTLNKNGTAEVRTTQGNTTLFLGSGDFDEFLSYILSLAEKGKEVENGYEVTVTVDGKTVSVTIPSDDPILNGIVGGGSGDGEEDPFGDFFSPTPGSGGSSGGSGGSGSSGGSEGSGEEDDCPFWRLSYCVYPIIPSPSPSPNPSPTPIDYPDDTEWNCGLWSDVNNLSTIISYTVCIIE